MRNSISKRSNKTVKKKHRVLSMVSCCSALLLCNNRNNGGTVHGFPLLQHQGPYQSAMVDTAATGTTYYHRSVGSLESSLAPTSTRRNKSIRTFAFRRDHVDLLGSLASAFAPGSSLSSASSVSTLSSLAAVPVLLATTASAAATVANPLASLDPLLEAEVLNDLAHVSLDLFTVFGPARLVTRMAAVIGRIFSMLADYLPDHKVLPEELVFQTIMMGLACFGLLQALLPVALAAITPVSAPKTLVRDGKAFTMLFEPTGMTWSQFKAMRTFCLDWIQVEPGHIINPETTDDDNDYIYWLFRGQVEVLSGDGSKVLQRVTAPAVTKVKQPSSHLESVGQRLLGETRLLLTSTTTPAQQQANASKGRAASTITKAVHPDGATLLRIHPRKLKFLCDSDPDLAEAIRHLVLNSLQDKFMAAQHLMMEQHEKITAQGETVTNAINDVTAAKP